MQIWQQVDSLGLLDCSHERLIYYWHKAQSATGLIILSFSMIDESNRLKTICMLSINYIKILTNTWKCHRFTGRANADSVYMGVSLTFTNHF
jgi:hypothetical protein